MARGEGWAQIVITLSTKKPIEVGDFVAAFTSVESQYEKFVRDRFPDAVGEAKIFVREIKKGSIIAELLPFVPHVLLNMQSVIGPMDQILIVDEFVRRYGGALKAYFKGGKVEEATRSDLKDFMGAVVAIANDPNGKGSIKAVVFEDGKRKLKANIKFNSAEAHRAVENIEEHRRTLELKSNADYQRVLMVFRQSNVKDLPVGKRTGEWVAIDDIHPDKELPLIYASDLAEQRIKHEIREADDNVYKKGFVVDVNLLAKGQKPIAYRVTNLHQVIDLQ